MQEPYPVDEIKSLNIRVIHPYTGLLRSGLRSGCTAMYKKCEGAHYGFTSFVGIDEE
jgi:hypothetical protein